VHIGAGKSVEWLHVCNAAVKLQGGECRLKLSGFGLAASWLAQLCAFKGQLDVVLRVARFI
jgi:hypothetical protein